jgi:hypothetical protein
MNRISASLGLAALVITGASLSAEDFHPLMKTTGATWPQKQHIGVICNYQASQDAVKVLAMAAGTGSFITVVDTRVPEQAAAAASLMASRKADYVVLLPHDRLFRDGSFGATVALSQLARRGVPAIGTTAVALRQGAVFSIGEGTAGQLLVTNRLIGTVDVILPNQSKASDQASYSAPEAGQGMATIAVFAAE